MSVYISGRARRAGAAEGSQGSSTSSRGGAAGRRGGGDEKREAGHAITLPGGPASQTSGGRGLAEDETGERSEGSARAVYRAGVASGWGLRGGVCQGVCISVQELSYCLCLPCCCTVLLQHGADPNIRNTDGKSALDLAEPSAKAVLTVASAVPIVLPLW
ncbi:hypothetical protein ATANTOWER_003372 [Ataeniobius toweri]|uniref:Uncharacterized protein n=1 Tax=Ataeniobius toweri TaxID=208326 RepID=A0ABU7BX51_9TELE|nr:hypothetical protein [Ataeniobius toweri]